uniref:Uncharacterized protein n=1 Tax=Mucochytrium quahogii TaxID=96639 RepID=A0A7S2WKY0_9STRA|mmetsp:Transcript_9432/g.15415  ORF Transcript_9432/g.15415 Transcript_9432/m.15415 type:complete len:359 (+) Transcript_9432:271-1347(+)
MEGQIGSQEGEGDPLRSIQGDTQVDGLGMGSRSPLDEAQEHEHLEHAQEQKLPEEELDCGENGQEQHQQEQQPGQQHQPEQQQKEQGSSDTDRVAIERKPVSKSQSGDDSARPSLQSKNGPDYVNLRGSLGRVHKKELEDDELAELERVALWPPENCKVKYYHEFSPVQIEVLTKIRQEVWERLNRKQFPPLPPKPSDDSMSHERREEHRSEQARRRIAQAVQEENMRMRGIELARNSTDRQNLTQATLTGYQFPVHSFVNPGVPGVLGQQLPNYMQRLNSADRENFALGTNHKRQLEEAASLSVQSNKKSYYYEDEAQDDDSHDQQNGTGYLGGHDDAYDGSKFQALGQNENFDLAL